MRKISLVYFQSGGPTSVINSSLYGLIQAAKEDPNVDKIYGSLYGVEGLINDNVVDLRKENEEELRLLLQTPGAALGSARRKIKPEEREGIFAKIKATMLKHGLNVIFVNGGNDSMDTCALLSEYFKDSDIQVLGIPKTVDNDLPCNDHTLGYPSAAKTIINHVKSISVDVDAYSKGKVTLIEMMGRDTGWLPASTALIEEPYGPDYIYLPEMGFDEEEFLRQVKETYEKKKRCLIILPEYLPWKQDSMQIDAFGHAYNEGNVHRLAALVISKLGYPTRGVGLSLLVRSSPFLLSDIDQKEALEMSKFMLKAALNGETGKVGIINRDTSVPYASHPSLVDAKEIANTVRYVPASWIKSFGKINVEEVEAYLKPLLGNDIKIETQDGQFRVAHLKLERE